VRSHRALLALLLCFLLDAAVPFEAAARGGVQLEIEDQGEEGVCARRRPAERPVPADAEAPHAPGRADAARSRVALAVQGVRAAEAAADSTRAVAPRARAHAADPASPAEDH
jgi:hypothetical protein